MQTLPRQSRAARPATETRWASTHRQPRRSAICIVELLVVLPVVLLIFLTVVLFGLLLARGHQVTQAASIGSSAASTQGRLPAATLINSAIDAVDAHLAVAGISNDPNDRQVIVEEKTTGSTGTIASSGAAFHTMDDPLGIPVETIRVTVAVRLTALAPDLLASYEYSVENGYLFASVLRPYNGPLP
jgi:hypothetical protein